MNLLEERVVLNCPNKKINLKGKMFLPTCMRRFSSGLTEFPTVLLLVCCTGGREPGQGFRFCSPSRGGSSAVIR